MNKERIKKLIEQSTTIEEHGWGASYEHFDKEKFAEMIVRECADVAFLEANSRKTQRAVLQHFGVEE